MTQDLIDISAIVTPFGCMIALLLKICPMSATKTVTKDNSIDFAIAAYRVDAMGKGRFPVLETVRPYRGFMIAMKSQMPENTVE